MLSGFREVLGVYIKNIKFILIWQCLVNLLNGYPITVLAGKSETMKESYNTFISSTYWSERIGSTAALATIKEMERLKSWRIIVKGKYIKNKIIKLSKKYKIKLDLNDLNQ